MKLIFNIIFYKGSPPKKLQYCAVCGKYKSENRFKRQICDDCRTNKPIKRLNKIIYIVCKYFKIKEEIIFKNSRENEIVKYRQICMYFGCSYSGLNFIEIGSIIGGKDHATVSHAKKTVNNLIDTDKKYKSDINKINKLILKKIKS